VFPPTRAAAERPADQRLPVAEHYRDREDYLRQVRAAATELAAEGFLLPEDIDPVVAVAGTHYDAATEAGPCPPGSLNVLAD
jgi:hypothetical protein